MTRKMYTVTEAAEILRVHVNTVRNKIKKGELGHLRIGRAVRLTHEHIEEYIAAVDNPREAHRDDSSMPQNVPQRGLPPHAMQYVRVVPGGTKAQS